MVGNLIEAFTSIVEPIRLELPNAFPAAANIPDKAGSVKHLEVLSDRLPRDFGAGRELGNGPGTRLAQASQHREPSLVT